MVKEFWYEGDSMTLAQQKDGTWQPAKPLPYYSSWLEKIKCFIGLHGWTWKAKTESVNGQRTLIIDEDIPPHAKCYRCEKLYGLK